MGGSIAADPVQRLAQRWEAAKQKYREAPENDDDPTANEAWDEREAGEAEISALRKSLDGIALNLRVVAWWMEVEKAECALGDGVTRTSKLEFDEQMPASALADIERLAASGTRSTARP